ncbi:MAG: NADP-dependent phosphogluconate dehydrogenase [Pseudomonadota bacterium]
MREIGLLGLGAMGRNLALNFVDQGTKVVAWDKAPQAGRELHAGVQRCESLNAVVDQLSPPRCIVLMVPAGGPVDDVLEQLLERLDSGDCVVDAGNSLFSETRRRSERARPSGVHFVGLGVSGGPSGARQGPSMMFGGPEGAWRSLRPLLEASAAEGPLGPCVARLGDDGAGHFVKMVHNGIEYADMQLLAEITDLLGDALEMSYAQIADLFEHWQSGEHQSFLLEITIRILRTRAPDGERLLDHVADRAGQKGTGRWTVATALELGVPVPAIAAAVDARALSGRSANRDGLRAQAGRLTTTNRLSLRRLDSAALLARLAIYAQGLQLMQAGAAEYGWPFAQSEPLRLWTAGCIIRAELLQTALAALDDEPDAENLLFTAMLRERVGRALPDLAHVVRHAAANGVPTPVLSSTLGWLQTATRERLPQHLIAAQRDAFGQHGYRRRDGTASAHADGLHRDGWSGN